MALFLALIAAPIYALRQHASFQTKSASDWAYAYKGWYGHPDSVNKVYIDPTFTEEQKTSIRAAMARWNAAGAHPRYVETSSFDDHDVCIWRNDDLPGGGGKCEPRWCNSPNGRYIYHAVIQIDTNGYLSVAEIATHELGHAQGLLDTTGNPADAMKRYGSTPSKYQKKMEMSRSTGLNSARIRSRVIYAPN